MGTLGLIVKATRLCNLRCKYCFDWRAGPGQVMSFDVLVNTIEAATRSARADTITFNWHGGEPTVLPMEFYERALYLQRRFRRPGQQLINTVQTNATLLDSDWVNFFTSNGFAIGVSVDGPAEVHDSLRVDQSGRGTFDRVCEGIGLLRDHDAAFAVILVIDQPTIARGADELLDFLLDQQITNVAFNFVMPAPASDAVSVERHYVDPATMCRFLIEVWDARRARGLTHIRVRELDAIETSLAGERPTPCTFAGSCFGLVFRVEPNGDVYHCDYFGTDPSYRWGNITSSDFDQLRKSAPLNLARRTESVQRQLLRACPHYELCRGWCPHGRRTAETYAPGYQQNCCGLADLISHMSSHRSSDAAAPSRRDPTIDGLLEVV